MCAKSLTAVVAALLLSPAALLAGGPPRLCLPVNGVTADNANVCAKRLADALGDRVVGKVELRENDKQWYAMFHFNCERVALAELDAALKGSPFSIARDNLRFFGHVMLEVRIDEASEQQLLSDLKAVKHLTVEKSERGKCTFFVTVVMPYPKYFGRDTAEFGKTPVKDERFGAEPNDFAPRTTTPATASDLPSYDAFRTVVEKHKGSLSGVRWECWGCRVLGGVAVAEASGKPK
jgi:hypothetical protein